MEQSQLVEEVKRQYQVQYQALQQNAQQQIQTLLNELSLKDVQLDFERNYNVIFGSQIQLLEILLPNPEGETRLFLELYFAQVKKAYFPVFENWQLENYLNFLLNKRLIEIVPSNGKYKITPRGSTFLSYITSINYSKNKGL